MIENKNYLINIIQSHKDELVESICVKLEQLSASHYEVIHYEHHLEREEAFIDAFVKSINEKEPLHFVQHMQMIAKQRSKEGYEIEEVYQAVDIVEETLWNLFVTELPLEKFLLTVLTMLRKNFNLARIELGKIYLNQAQQKQKELDDLREKFYIYRTGKKDDLSDPESTH